MFSERYRACIQVLMGLFILLAFSFHAEGQRKRDQKKELDENLVQFSGIVRDLQHRSLPDVNIIILTERRGTTSDQRGMFSFVVRPSDTILFSHMGHKGTIHVIPDSLGGQQYPADIFMVSDTFHLAEVRIYPWKTYQQFKEAFLALDLPDDDEQRAYHNIALIKTQIKMNDFGPSPNINFREVMKQQYNQLYTAGQTPYYTIFDPMRWAKFFESLKRGDFKQED
ncbi:MAG: carboxypeptidase-like regulatory domain-containing protein [Bacteroidales bacterium]|nr:carboxypeptidase-like regulatory domain-containing protein [Bacteroidales bacterium]